MGGPSRRQAKEAVVAAGWAAVEGEVAVVAMGSAKAGVVAADWGLRAVDSEVVWPLQPCDR